VLYVGLQLCDQLQKEMVTCIGKKIIIGDGCTVGSIAHEKIQQDPTHRQNIVQLY
jgi:hypothetical protein